MPYFFFSRSSAKFQGHGGGGGAKNRQIWPNLSVSGLKSKPTNVYEMMRKAWVGIEDVLYCFSRSSVKFQGHRRQKIVKFDPIWTFPDSNSNVYSLMAAKWCIDIEEMPYCFWRSYVKFQGHRRQGIANVDLMWAFPDCNHYSDVIMGEIASQITSPAIVYSTFYSDADQRKYQSPASLAFVRGIHRGPVNSPHKWPVTRKMFPFDDVIMTQIWIHWWLGNDT